MAVLLRDCFAVLFRFFRHIAHQRFVLTLWTWTCSPLPIFALAMPMSWPYFQTVSPFLISVSATLWPIGTSIFDFSLNDELSWVTTHSMSVPFFRPSTTTTPTVSFLSCTSNCGIAMILPGNPRSHAGYLYGWRRGRVERSGWSGRENRLCWARGCR